MLKVNTGKYFKIDEQGRTIFFAKRKKGHIVPDEAKKADIVRALIGKERSWLWSYLFYVATAIAAVFTLLIIPALKPPIAALFFLAVCIPGVIFIMRRANARVRKAVEGLEDAPENLVLREAPRGWNLFLSDIRSGLLWVIMIGLFWGAGFSIKMLAQMLSMGTFGMALLMPLLNVAWMSVVLWVLIKELRRRSGARASVDTERQR